VYSPPSNDVDNDIESAAADPSSDSDLSLDEDEDVAAEERTLKMMVSMTLMNLL